MKPVSSAQAHESPAEIGGALSYFTSQNGTLPSSATTLTTGYDFLNDGAQSVAGAAPAVAEDHEQETDHRALGRAMWSCCREPLLMP